MNSILLKAIGSGFLMTLLLCIPLLGPFSVGLLLIPVCLIPHPFIRQFCESGEQVEVGFAWITLHSPTPFFFYWACFSVIALALYRFAKVK